MSDTTKDMVAFRHRQAKAQQERAEQAEAENERLREALRHAEALAANGGSNLAVLRAALRVDDELFRALNGLTATPPDQGKTPDTAVKAS